MRYRRVALHQAPASELALAIPQWKRNKQTMPDRADDMADRKLTLEWAQLDDGSRALVFGPKTWALFEQAAKAKEMDARHMISKVVTEAFGTIMMDNYVLNRFLGKDAH